MVPFPLRALGSRTHNVWMSRGGLFCLSSDRTRSPQPSSSSTNPRDGYNSSFSWIDNGCSGSDSVVLGDTFERNPVGRSVGQTHIREPWRSGSKRLSIEAFTPPPERFIKIRTFTCLNLSIPPFSLYRELKWDHMWCQHSR